MSLDDPNRASVMLASDALSPIPRLQEPIQLEDTSMCDTPDVSQAMDQRLNFRDSSDEDEIEESDLEDTASSEDEERESRTRGVPISELATGLCYDDRMRYHAEVAATTGENVHPEDPRRIYFIYKELREAGLVAVPPLTKADLIVRTPLRMIPARAATKEECCLVHSNTHYEFVKSTAGITPEQCDILSQWIADRCPMEGPLELTDEELIDLSEDVQMDSIYFNKLSYFSALLSAGAAIETCRAVVERKVKNAIAVIRPPGHHAEVQSTMGFCLFNNVCIASRVCQQDYGMKCRKILIVDW
jgi:histone deacetylase 6